VKPATHEPLEFREKSTGQVTTVAADFVGGTFRTLLPEGRYTVTQGDRHTSLTVLPGGSYRVDLRPGEAFDFQATAESAPNGAVTIRISAEGSGRHRFTIRTENLALDGAERVIELAPGKPATLAWSGSVASRDTPSVAVVVPDGSLVQRRELTGVPAAR
jgi:hypothetical protein